MATMARITTTSRAAAMITAAVGLSPNVVVRSPTAARGSAAPSLLRTSEPAGVETEPLPLGESLGGAAAGAGAWVPGGVLPLCAAATLATPNAESAMSRTTARLFMLHLLRPECSNGGAIGTQRKNDKEPR